LQLHFLTFFDLGISARQCPIADDRRRLSGVCR